MRENLRRAAGYGAILVVSGLGLGFAAAWGTRTPPAEGPVELRWERLVAHGGWFDSASPSAGLIGVVLHGQIDPSSRSAPGNAELVRDFDGERVRLPGYMVPIDFDGVGAREFLLVPFVGACIHVPPPPPNQIVYVSSQSRVRVESQFQPVVVTGTFAAAPLSTDLAEVGYRIVADSVTPHTEQ